MTTPAVPAIRRGFVDTSFGQVHYRTIGDGPVLIMHHASPGSAKQLEGLMRLLAAEFRVVAFDTPGNGDSSPLSIATPTIADLAAGLLQAVVDLGIEQAVVYGSHTGANIAMELAIAAPGIVRKVVLDGIAVFSPEQQADYLKRYALPFTADLDGAYLMRCFMFCRDQYLFFPWFARDREHRRANGLGTPQALHNWVLEVLKANDTYPLSYRAAFAYDPPARIGLVGQPILALASEDDPLLGTTRDVATQAGAMFGTLPGFQAPDYGARLRDAVIVFAG
ncbi:alpha/beta hydrolase [Azospirillum sp. B4]|uniref:alpha/beta hydrolase n=1 Tax=Azospirillum sp. B4 TaxID=95605 RepID=UPI0003462CA7|nr:alpha/beta fold hydrolase [Azospirillum sp. B4]